MTSINPFVSKPAVVKILQEFKMGAIDRDDAHNALVAEGMLDVEAQNARAAMAAEGLTASARDSIDAWRNTATCIASSIRALIARFSPEQKRRGCR